jgi:hypothetical protein
MWAKVKNKRRQRRGKDGGLPRSPDWINKLVCTRRAEAVVLLAE